MNPQISGQVRVGTVVTSALSLVVSLAGPLFATPATAASAAITAPTVAAPAAADSSTVTLWGEASPRTTKVRNKSAVELGTTFTVRKSGKATGIRFYKVAGMTGKHTGTLWSRSGKKLARVTFSDESSTGWQSARFATAVSLKKGSTYIVSYHVSRGTAYARSSKTAAASITSALSVPPTSVASTSKKVTFPKKKKSRTRYWVDVQFVPSAGSSSGSGSGSGSSNTGNDPGSTVTGNTSDTAVKGFPTSATTGVPAGWSPKSSYTGDYYVTDDNATLSDVRITGGNLYIWGKNVTVRNVEIVDGRIINFRSPVCYNGLDLENVSIIRKNDTEAWDPAVEAGGYTANKLKVDGRFEGLRVGGIDFATACRGAVITNSWISVQAPNECWTNPGANAEWHGDALQGYMGAEVTIKDSYLGVNGVPPNCGGNSAFFWPDQGNGSATVQNLLVAGGGYPFRLETPGSVSGLKVVDGSWEYDGPTSVSGCSKINWGSGNEVVKVNADGSLTSVRPISCG